MAVIVASNSYRFKSKSDNLCLNLVDINKECSDALQIASEKEFISNEATYPNSPLHNTSSAPTQGEETIFLSKIKASIITVGNPSYREDKTNTSQDFIKGYGFSLNPKKCT